MIDNLCDNALDLTNEMLIVEYNWPDGTYCQWLISTQEDDGYVTLEFQNFNVRNSVASKRNLHEINFLIAVVFLTWKF